MIYEKPVMKDWIVACDFCSNSVTISSCTTPEPPDGWFYEDKWGNFGLIIEDTLSRQQLKCVACIEKEQKELHDKITKVLQNAKNNG